MQLERPRFRQDLVAEPIEDGNTKFIDVMDPDSGNVFRFYEVEYSLACAMDGERDVPGIMRWAQEELGLSASANEVKNVIATLGELNYLDGAAARPETTAPTAKPSIWDPPAPAQDDMLGRGVVVGQKRHNTPVPDMELGNAGVSAPQAQAPAPPASNIELVAGVTTGRSSQQAKPKVEDIALGVPGRSDVSVDLSDQVPVSTKDVKEAVRASKVMNAVEIPDDLKNALDSAEATPPPKPRKPPPTPAKGMPAVDPLAAEKAVEAAKAADTAKAEAAKAEAAKAAAAKATKTAAKPLPKQVEASKQPEARPAVAPPAPEMKANRGLVVVLIVVAVAAAVFFVYKYVLAKSSSETTQVTPPKLPEPPPPAPPPVETEKLAESAPMQDSIKPVSAGTIEMIAGVDAKVKEGDPLVRFTGAKALDTELAALEKDIAQRVKPELFKAEQERDAAIASGNKAAQTAGEAKVADRQKSLDDKQGKLATKKSDRDKLEIKSPAAGTFTAKAKVTQKVTPTDELGMLLHAPTKTVTFKKADAGPKSRVLLVTNDNKKLSCVVTSADATGVAIECPDDAAPAGTEVTFGGVDTSPTPDTNTGSGADAGSGAGSDAGSGAGSAAAGSAAGSTGSASAVPSPAPTRPATPARSVPARPVPARAQPKTPPVDKPADKPATETPPAPTDPAAVGSGSGN